MPLLIFFVKNGIWGKLLGTEFLNSGLKSAHFVDFPSVEFFGKAIGGFYRCYDEDLRQEV